MARKSRKTAAIPETQAKRRPVFNVGGYVRLSALDRKQKGDSIETQQAIIAAFVEEHPDMTLRELYIDNGLSGQQFERPAFQQMLADAESGKIDCLVTKDLSRLGRNTIDTGFYIEKYFPAHSIRFIAINDDYDSADANSGGIMVSLKNMVNERYALEIGRKIRATKQMNIQAGAFVGRFPPFGYLKSKEDKHKLVVDADAAPVVLQIYQMAANGLGVSAIVKHLNDTGVLTPRRYFHSKGLASAKEADKHIHWCKGVVYSILHNRIYVGDMVQGKYRMVEHIEKKLPQSEWVITENTHEPIVSRELWAQVQELWGKQQRKKQVPYSENIFLRKIFCGHCGFSLRRRRNGKCYAFQCETRQTYDKADCVQVSINEDNLKTKLLAMLRKQAAVLGAIPVVGAVHPHNAELKSVRLEIDKARGFLKGLYESLVGGDVTPDEYREMKLDYEVKIDELTARERGLRNDKQMGIARGAVRSKASGDLAALHSTADLTAEMVDALIERIDVSEGGHIKVKFTFRNEVMSDEELHDSKVSSPLAG